MTGRPAALDHPPASLAAATLPALRGGLVVGALLLSWIGLHPFVSLGTSASVELSSGNDAPGYVMVLGLAAGALALGGPHREAVFRALGRGPALALMAWLGLTSVVSADPSTSLRRFVLAVLVLVVMALVMPLAGSQARLARLLAIAMGTVLVLSYGGVAFAPDLSIHQVTDVGEPDLAGDWRGVFAHKNDAAAVFSQFAFMGLFVARSGLPFAGGAITLGALVFVVFSGGKSALALLVLAGLTAGFWRWRGRGALRVVVALAPVVLINVAGVGSVLVPAIGTLVHALPVDSTFTGRTDVWSFAIDNLAGHVLTGHGFDAFWNTADTRFGGEEGGWAGTAAHAHNSFLDTVVGSGLPALALALLVFVRRPCRDAAAAERRGCDPALVTMLLQVWLFTLYLSGMETVFFDRNGPIWTTFLLAVVGLRYAAAFPLRKVDPQ